MKKIINTYKIYRNQGSAIVKQKTIRKLKILVTVKTFYNRIVYGKALGKLNKYLTINPKNVNYMVAPRFRPEVFKYPIMRGGNWDENIINHKVTHLGENELNLKQRGIIHFENYTMYTSFRDRILYHKDWRKTTFYKEIEKRIIDNKKTAPTYNNIQSMHRRLKYNDYLINEFVQKGQLKKHVAEDFRKEICIVLGRKGHIYFDEGRHRFIIAKALGITTLNVVVVARHKQWVKQRKKFIMRLKKNRQIDSFLYEHPDMQEFLEEKKNS